MSKSKQLLVEHLEHISWRVLEEYPQIIRDMLRGRSGVYALYRKGKLYYVGLASSMMARLKTHVKDRHHGRWDRFSVYLTIGDRHMKELESMLLRIVHPRGNKQTGKFSASENLGSALNRSMRETDADRRAILLGGHVARRRRRTKTKGAKGTRVLAGVVDRRMNLKATRKGWEYRAALRKDGAVSYGGRLYDSPSAAARAAVGHACNGWQFWCYRDDNGEWMPLKKLKR